MCAAIQGGTGLVDLPSHLTGEPMLTGSEAADVFHLARYSRVGFGVEGVDYATFSLMNSLRGEHLPDDKAHSS